MVRTYLNKNTTTSTTTANKRKQRVLKKSKLSLRNRRRADSLKEGNSTKKWSRWNLPTSLSSSSSSSSPSSPTSSSLSLLSPSSISSKARKSTTKKTHVILSGDSSNDFQNSPKLEFSSSPPEKKEIKKSIFSDDDDLIDTSVHCLRHKDDSLFDKLLKETRHEKGKRKTENISFFDNSAEDEDGVFYSSKENDGDLLFKDLERSNNGRHRLSTVIDKIASLNLDKNDDESFIVDSSKIENEMSKQDPTVGNITTRRRLRKAMEKEIDNSIHVSSRPLLTASTPIQKDRTSIQTITSHPRELICSCEIKSNQTSSIPCSNCSRQFHMTCYGVTKDSQSWICPECISSEKSDMSTDIHLSPPSISLTEITASTPIRQKALSSKVFVKLQPLSESMIERHLRNDNDDDIVICTCKSPCNTRTIIQCVDCSERFHAECYGVSEDIKLSSWRCPECSEEHFRSNHDQFVMKGGKAWKRKSALLSKRSAEFQESRARNSFVRVPIKEDENENDSLQISVVTTSTSINETTVLDQLLLKCDQIQILKFSDFYSDEILRTSKKVGEGSFGEVFMLGDEAVLKVIPIEGDKVVNGEPQTQIVEVLSEIEVSLDLSHLSDKTVNFVEVRGCHLVAGHYPPILLDLWDDYNLEKESLNDRPDFLGPDQKFVTFEFGNGGSDLEGYTLVNAAQGIAIFNQVAHALAVAEVELEFEHRDLHWGNILISHTESESIDYFVDETSLYSVKTSGVKVTIIDFSLSRLTSSSSGNEIFKDLSQDEALFQAKGDYQFEIYRLMRKSNDDDWRRFNPYTNVLWLHYLLDKLLTQVEYKNRKSRIHRSSLSILRSYKAKMLDYLSAKHFVLEEGVPVV